MAINTYWQALNSLRPVTALWLNTVDDLMDLVDFSAATVLAARIIITDSGVTIPTLSSTTLTATTGTIPTLGYTTATGTNLQITNIKANDGTASASIANSTGVMTIASSVLTTADINGGTIDGTAIGGASAAAGTFTDLTVTGNTTLGDAASDTIDINGVTRIVGVANTFEAPAAGTINSNAYYSGGWKYRTSSYTSSTLTLAGATNPFTLSVAVSGTAGNAITYLTALTAGTAEAGLIKINSANTSGVLNVLSTSTAYVADFRNTAASNSNYGIYMRAGSTSSDVTLDIQSSTGTQYLKIRGDGMIGTNSVNTGTAFYLGTDTTTNAAQYGFHADAKFSSAATTSGMALYIRPRTAAAAFTQTSTYGLYVADASKGAGSTISTYYSLFVDTPTAGGTNYGIYVAGTTNNYFGAGLNGFGAAPTANQQVTITAASGNKALGLNGAAGSNTFYIGANTTTNQSYGQLVWAGTSSSDYAMYVRDATGASSYLQIRGDGLIGVGAVANAGVLMYLGANAFTAGTNQYTAQLDATLSSTATNSMNGLYARVKAATATYTTTSSRAIYIDDASKGGAGHTITNQYGLYVASMTVGGTNYSIYCAGTADQAYFGSSVVCGAPTGGAKGTGTINATAVYDDNVLLTCYVSDAYRTGSVDLAVWDAFAPDQITKAVEDADGNIIEESRVIKRKHTGAHKFAARLGTDSDPLDIEKYANHFITKKHLSSFPNRDKFKHGDMSTGEWLQRCVEQDEIQAVHIIELNKRIKDLESRIQALEGKVK